MKLCGFDIGLDQPFFLIAGPCVIESEQLQMDTAGTLKEITCSLGIPFIFKSSYDKANRSSGTTFRGPGMVKGLEILAKVKRELGVPILTDVHSETDIAAVAAVVDVLQTPAFLCRQTDFITAVAQSGRPVNIKKGQFLAPGDMKNVIDKARAAALAAGLDEARLMACERGPSFRYRNGTCGSGCGRGGSLHGDAPGPCQCHELRPQRRAAQTHARLARNFVRARPRDQEKWLSGKQLWALISRSNFDLLPV